MLAQILTTILGFFLLVVVLRRFFWRTVLQLLDARRAKIEGDLRQAAQQKADVERLSAQLNQRLAAIDEEARAKIQQAVLEGRRIGMEVQEEARAQAQGILAKSRETIELELAKAKVSLRDEMADMTMETVERLLKHKLNPETDRQLVTSILDELGASGGKD